MKKVVLISLLVLSIASLANAQCETLTYWTESLRQFYVGEPSNFDLEAVGGTPPYTFEIVDGVLPAGMHMNANGKIRGVPREPAQTTILVKLTDANGCTLHQAFNLSVE